MSQVVKMSNVVTFELEPGAATFTEYLQDVFDILERISEYEVPTVFEMRPLPLIAKFIVAGQHRKQTEVHGAHIERRHLGLNPKRGGQALIQRHTVTAARGDVNYGIAPIADRTQKLHENIGIRGGSSVFRVPCMQV